MAKDNLFAYLNSSKAKTDICLKVDTKLLNEARQYFRGEFSKIFESALKDALAEKQLRLQKAREKGDE
jgi:hypothetical protein